MPKISANTVAQHRVMQRGALVQCATDILVTRGVEGVTPASVSAAAGLSRPAFYQYFSSSAEILATIIEEAFPRANEAISAALRGITDPKARIEIYIRTTLRLASEGVHRPAAALAAARLPQECQVRLHELHRQQLAPFVDALAELEIADRDITGHLLGGALHGAITALESGLPQEPLIEAMVLLARSAILDFPLI